MGRRPSSGGRGTFPSAGPRRPFCCRFRRAIDDETTQKNGKLFSFSSILDQFRRWNSLPTKAYFCFAEPVFFVFFQNERQRFKVARKEIRASKRRSYGVLTGFYLVLNKTRAGRSWWNRTPVCAVFRFTWNGSLPRHLAAKKNGPLLGFYRVSE